MEILLLTLYFCVKCFVDHCLCLCPSVLSGDLVAHLYFCVKCFVDHCLSLYLPFLVRLLLTLYFCVKCFVDHCLSLCPSVLSGDLVAHSLLLCEVFCRSLFVPLSFRS